MSEMIKDFALSEMQKSGQERAGVGHEKVEGPSQEIKPCTRARLEHAAIVALFTENAEEEEESVASPPSSSSLCSFAAKQQRPTLFSRAERTRRRPRLSPPPPPAPIIAKEREKLTSGEAAR